MPRREFRSSDLLQPAGIQFRGQGRCARHRRAGDRGILSVRLCRGPSGSCAGMLKVHYPELFRGDPNWAPRANAIAAKCFELVSFLVDVLGIKTSEARFEGEVTYHDACSGLRELGIKTQPRALLATVSGLTLKEMPDAEICCGFGGTFRVKYPEISNAIVTKKAATNLRIRHFFQGQTRHSCEQRARLRLDAKLQSLATNVVVKSPHLRSRLRCLPLGIDARRGSKHSPNIKPHPARMYTHWDHLPDTGTFNMPASAADEVATCRMPKLPHHLGNGLCPRLNAGWPQQARTFGDPSKPRRTTAEGSARHVTKSTRCSCVLLRRRGAL